MRTTILPMAVILTKAHRPAVYCRLSTASEVFLIFTNQLHRIPISQCVFLLHYLVTSLKYSFLHISKQYFMLLTSGG